MESFIEGLAVWNLDEYRSLRVEDTGDVEAIEATADDLRERGCDGHAEHAKSRMRLKMQGVFELLPRAAEAYLVLFRIVRRTS